MAIMALVTGKISKFQYESLRNEVNWEKDAPSGLVIHAASFDASDRIHVADVWETMEEMAAFFEKRLGPAMKKLGISPLESVVYPIHNVDAYEAIEKHRI
jgi:hypothetical protein